MTLHSIRGMRAAATRAGCTTEQLMLRSENGLRYCSVEKAWRPKADFFPSDHHPYGARCKECLKKQHAGVN